MLYLATTFLRKRILSGLVLLTIVSGGTAFADPQPRFASLDFSTNAGSLPAADDFREHAMYQRGQLLVLGFAGDIGFSGHNQPASASGAVRHGAEIPWSELFEGISPILHADANFGNLETVVSARTDLPPVEKTFNFISHPAALGELARAGISVLTAANNHAADFGADGIEETLASLNSSPLKAYAGLGIGDGRYIPSSFQIGDATIALGAIGIGINPAGAAGPGQPLYASTSDFSRVTSALRATAADIRVLSAHYGKELDILPGASDRARLRSALDDDSADIIFGHHSHVGSGIELRGGRLIFYGLGNFMHAGTQDMARYGDCRDFGIYAKVYIWIRPGDTPVIRAAEVFPIVAMHERPRLFSPEATVQRLSIVNALNADVSESPSAPVRFSETGAASGLACFGSQFRYGDELAARCAALLEPIAPASLAICTLATDTQITQKDPVLEPPRRRRD